MKSEWIGIDKELPEYDERVLLRGSEFPYTRIGHRTHTDGVGEHYKSGGGPISTFTHWMPLPEPPEDE